ncbi:MULTISPECIES: phycobiliprotein lyase [Moorena]|uniref:Chromophore lyase CpcS/CpeS n=1 Tax=Moorena producens 3L TaxID=489825 RepID=F4XQV2_9CYAN|nr:MULTISPECIES: phycobiliprotein lyase [Moorena]EGJ32927.1 CpeS-like protein [Moorena producens 3L]NEP64079.1 phycobiliprotein lyase [Moorena sp. SIO3A5]NER89835.1 phycobiliprotein lyase [Moorena sp. SIO3A2]OLT68308.1 phycobiliprotein lyase [Moorena producens 3L]
MRLKPPMTMMDFFRKSEGKWFTQRTVHHFDNAADESGESNLIVQVIEKDNPKVQTVCDLQKIDPSQAMGGASFMWQINLDDREPSSKYAAILIDVPDDETKLSGKLIRDQGYVESIPVVSRYWFGKDGILTIDTNYQNNQGQERCWFITDDFRVRVSTVRMMNGVNLMTYCSERRCVSREMLEQMIETNRARAMAVQ